MSAPVTNGAGCENKCRHFLECIPTIVHRAQKAATCARGLSAATAALNLV